MRKPTNSTKLDYAPQRRISARSLNTWGWISVYGGMCWGLCGFLLVRYGPPPEVHWLDVSGLLFMFGGAALCITGIVLVAIAASHPH